ncbi:MAG: hypothetical protein M1825_001777 [Sarcosagium campestre]|nr:MAG: hypothetical protein M1825_001777 [Sarcosagium campestre]
MPSAGSYYDGPCSRLAFIRTLITLTAVVLLVLPISATSTSLHRRARLGVTSKNVLRGRAILCPDIGQFECPSGLCCDEGSTCSFLGDVPVCKGKLCGSGPSCGDGTCCDLGEICVSQPSKACRKAGGGGSPAGIPSFPVPTATKPLFSPASFPIINTLSPLLLPPLIVPSLSGNDFPFSNLFSSGSLVEPTGAANSGDSSSGGKITSGSVSFSSVSASTTRTTAAASTSAAEPASASATTSPSRPTETSAGAAETTAGASPTNVAARQLMAAGSAVLAGSLGFAFVLLW